MNDKEQWLKLLNKEVQPVKIGNKSKTGKCGMCGIKANKLYPQRVGQVDFMICERCKMIMDMSGY
jgi:hypothetical protein